MALVTVWWAVFFALGIINLPLTRKLFPRFLDHGYPLAKIIGLMTVSYLMWLAASLKLLPFTYFGLILVIAADLGFNSWLVKKEPEIKVSLKKKWRLFLREELLFLGGLSFWAYIRSFQPDIYGLEKYMDFGFVKAILRSRFFPPNDMWLAGKSINYYYFGHLETAVLTRLTGIYAPVAYNLMMASLCGLTFSAGFSLAANLINWGIKKARQKPYLISLGATIAAMLLTFGGNWQIAYHQLKHGSLEGYWYPDATRFIIEESGARDNTIHEFPIYSLVVADLHGHLLDIPHVLLIMSLLVSLAQNFRKKFSFKQNWWKAFWEKEKIPFRVFLLTFLGVTLGIAFMTNAWDYPIYLLLSGCLLLWFHLEKSRKPIWQTAKDCLWLVGTSLLAGLPFHLNFESIAQGVALVDFRSPLWMLFFLWGFPLLITVFFLIFWLTKKKKQKADKVVFIFLLVAWSLICLPEVIRIKDIYAHNHQRANTMFKFTYQSFMMFSLMAGYVFIRLATNWKKYGRWVFLLLFSAGAGINMVYPRYAIRSYYQPDNEKETSLDGLEYLYRRYPDDYKAILWLDREIQGAPAIVEAVGESYTDFARVSANTGLPAVLGWRVHEWLWRGGFEIAGERTEEIRKIYTSQNPAEVKSLLENHRVKLVFVGSLEREAYPELNEENFRQLGEVIFESGETRVYRVGYN